uniref:Uncharacterized protein n=1 Tax=Ceratitis capitata TaxID=7213 RepID=W8CB43_CERCA
MIANDTCQWIMANKHSNNKKKTTKCSNKIKQIDIQNARLHIVILRICVRHGLATTAGSAVKSRKRQQIQQKHLTATSKAYNTLENVWKKKRLLVSVAKNDKSNNKSI